MKLTVRKGQMNSPTSESVPAEAEGESMEGAAAVEETVMVPEGASAVVSAPRPRAKSSIFHIVFAALGIIAVVCFAVLVIVQFSEKSYYEQSPSLWLAK